MKYQYKKYLKEKALDFAENNDLGYSIHNNKVIYDEIEYNFFPESWKIIKEHQDIYFQLRKIKENHRKGSQYILYTQEHDNELALLLSVLMHPTIEKYWDLFGLNDYKDDAYININKQFKIPSILKDMVINIDLELGDSLIVPILNNPMKANLSTTNKFERIIGIDEIFVMDNLYEDFRVSNFNIKYVEAIIVAYKFNKTPYFIMDNRNIESIHYAYKTINLIKDDWLRMKCKIISWQSLMHKKYYKFKDFIEEKYGITGDSPFSIDE